MTRVLDELIAGVQADLVVRQNAVPLGELRRRLGQAPAPLDPMPSFRRPGVSVIAEVKRASPSKGYLADIPEPAALVAQYQAGGASAISVLTERHRFGGSLDDLATVRASVGLPVLRKDFIVTEYQVIEARAYGADLCLLIVAALPGAELARLYALAYEIGLTPLVEVHTADETRRAVDIGAQLIGVNNRDLTTLQVDTAQFGRLAGLIPASVVKVAESGLQGPADVAQMHACGADVVLVGEALVKDGNPRATIAAMIASGGTK